jgi:hypothetical protein
METFVKVVENEIKLKRQFYFNDLKEMKVIKKLLSFTGSEHLKFKSKEEWSKDRFFFLIIFQKGVYFFPFLRIIVIRKTN